MIRLFGLKPNRTTKLISVFCLLIFFLGSGAGQVIHSVFHKHSFESSQQTATPVVSLPHSYCNALQLMLPEFSGSGIISVPAKIHNQSTPFPQIEITILHFSSFKTSDRAPPVAAQLV